MKREAPRRDTARRAISGRDVSRHDLPREVRIIGGDWKRTKLPVADAPGLRPTPDRVRETLFNWLGQTMTGWRCLDAFAGSGALGFEAASRGAASAVLIERDRHLARKLDDTKVRLKAENVRIENADALAWMARAPGASFDVIFIDPPFDSDLAAPAFVAATRVVVPGGYIYLESGSALAADAVPEGFTLFRQSRAGAVHFQLLRRVTAS